MADDKALIIDEHGRPISAAYIASLREEVSAVDASLGRPPFSGHLAFGMDPTELASIIYAADNGSSLDWFILAEEIEELFPHYGSVLSKRKRQVCQLPISVVAAGDDKANRAHASLIEDWLARDVLIDALFDVTDAIGKGFSVHEIMWDTQPGRIVPRELLYRPQRFFELDWLDGTTILLRDPFGKATDAAHTGMSNLAPHKFLVHRHRSKSGSVIRSGTTRMVAFLWMFSSYTLKDWALFCQAYGMPMRIGRYGPEASEGDKRVLWRAVSSIAGDVAATIPKSMEIEFVKGSDSAAGATLYEKRADWLNREVSKIVLGGTAGTDAIHGGHAVGQEHRAAEQDVERFDAQLLATTITRQLVRPMIDFTFGPQENYPTLHIGRPDEIPLNDFIAGVANLGNMGLTVKASEVRDRLQLTTPGPGDETIGGKPDPVAPPKLASVPLPETQGQVAALPWLGTLLTLQAEAPPELVEAMTQRLADDAAGAMAGMTAAIRAEFEAATDMRDLAHRLDKLELPQGEFVEAMTRGAALANLVGQASMVAELGRRR